MKINGEFILREVVGEYVLVPVGETSIRINGIISLNEVGATIWKGIEQAEDQQTIVCRILDSFDVTRQQAEEDVAEFLQLLKDKGLIV